MVSSNAVPLLISSADGATIGTGTPTFTWQAVPGATRYTIDLPDSSSNNLLGVTTSGCDGGQCAYAPSYDPATFPELVDGASYHWRVTAGTQSGMGSPSDYNTFTVQRVYVQLDYPANVMSRPSRPSPRPSPGTSCRVPRGMPCMSCRSRTGGRLSWKG